MAVSTGLGAVTMALLAFVEKGDHILVTDSVYGPTRSFCDRILTRFGVETTYYDPLVAGGISHLIRPNTRLVFTESPGSLTFEVQDIPAIASAARERGVAVLMDNTWGTPFILQALRTRGGHFDPGGDEIHFGPLGLGHRHHNRPR